MFSNSLTNFNTKNYWFYFTISLYTVCIPIDKKKFIVSFQKNTQSVGHMCLYYILNQTILFFFQPYTGIKIYLFSVCVSRRIEEWNENNGKHLHYSHVSVDVPKELNQSITTIIYYSVSVFILSSVTPL